MRTIVDLPDEQIKALDALVAQNDVSRAELVRRAVSLYLKKNKEKNNEDMISKYHGFLADDPDAFDGLDGLEYQNKIRSEWDERDAQYSNWGMQDSASGSYEHGSPKKK